MNSSILKHYKDIALSDKDVTNLLGGRVNIILYPNLHKYRDIDEVLGPHGACVLLFEAKKGYGHWVCLFKVGLNEIEFFNSYGGYPDDSLKKISCHYARISNQIIPYLSVLLLQSPYELSYNEFQFQKKTDGIRTCGRHCVFRLLNRDLDLYQYVDLLKILRKKCNTDYDGVVTIFTS